jgi:hypothetical protein
MKGDRISLHASLWKCNAHLCVMPLLNMSNCTGCLFAVGLQPLLALIFPLMPNCNPQAENNSEPTKRKSKQYFPEARILCGTYGVLLYGIIYVSLIQQSWMR